MTTYAYDPVGRLQTLSHNPVGTTRDHDIGFTYNPASQVRTRSASNDAYAWTPPANYVRTYGVNGLNQYTATNTSGAPVAYSYDPNGNLTADGSHGFVYDVENRLVSATGAHNAELAYDPLGRLFQVTSGASVRRLVYDGDALIAEYDSGGGMPHRYIHGNDPGADDPVAWYDNYAYGWRRILFHDHQGSIVQVADMYGNPFATNSYDPWGIPGSGNQGRFGYTGQTWLPELGMWYYKARVYSPVLGRFLQVDPIGYGDQLNLYAYVGNDPVNATDPEGTCTRIGEFTGCGGVEKSGNALTQYSGRSGRGPRGGSGGSDPRGRGNNPQTPGGIHQANIEARVSRLEEQVQTLSPGYVGAGNPPGQRTMDAVRTLESTVQTLRVTPIANNAEARAVAEALGYRQVGGLSSHS